jgi:hypothetical protein
MGMLHKWPLDMLVPSMPKSALPPDAKLEDVLADELKREMFVTTGLKFRYLDEWDTVLHSVYELPVEYDGYTKRVSDLHTLREMVDLLTRGEYDVKRSESRAKQLSEYKKTMHMYYNLIFGKADHRIGYGALIHFPHLNEALPERSKGIVLVARYELVGGQDRLSFEKARFEDFLIEVKPYIELLGDLYRSRTV